MQIQPYLFFSGRCEEALAFYKKTLGAEVEMLMRWKDSPEPPPNVPPGSEDKVMHASFAIGQSKLYASDGCPGQPTSFQGFSLSLHVADPAEAEEKFQALGEGGNVQMPLGKTFFSPAFGIVADKFGVSWMVYVMAEK